MISFLLQVVIPFILSAFIVILITIIAERYGTKIGGIIGTLPSTIIVAFLFIAINRNVYFAAQSAVVVPAEMGINLVFLFILTISAYRSIYIAIAVSLIVWMILSLLLFISNLEDIFISIVIYLVAIVFTFLSLEHIKKIPSIGSMIVHYTLKKIILRGLLAGIVIAIAVFLSNISSSLSGIFSVFPVIFLSTTLIALREHGPSFAGGMAKSMIFGSLSVMSYAVMIYFLYPVYDIFLGTILACIISIIITVILLKLSGKIR